MRVLLSFFVLITLVFGGVPTAVGAPDPNYSVPLTELEKGLKCPDSFQGGGEAVLLVHGAGMTSMETWGWNYLKALPESGLDTCRVRLPHRALDDLQKAAEYVVYAAKALFADRGKIDLVAYDAGGLATRWALRWWPSLLDQIDDLVLFATPNYGTYLAELSILGCFASCLQMRPSSQFLSLLNSEGDTPGPGISYTTIWSRTDEWFLPVYPAPSPELTGATNIAVQDLCTGRVLTHGGFLFDAVVYEIALDALTHPGSADSNRFEPATCTKVALDGVDAVEFALIWGDSVLNRRGIGVGATQDEPPPADYTSG